MAKTKGKEQAATRQEKKAAQTLDSLEMAKKIVDVAADKQASDVVLLDVREVCSFADYFVISSGESERQLEAIYDAVLDLAKKLKYSILHREGHPASGWLLLDLGDIVVHIFSVFEREYYQLDELWSKAPVVIRLL